MSSRHTHRAATPVAASLALGLTSVLASAAPVPFGGHTYDLILDDQASWSAAATAAGAAGGHLATITSAEEQSFVESLLSGRDAPTGAYWFGLTETATEGQFAPINGEQSSFSEFAPGEPNNGVGGATENSGSIYWTADVDAAFTTLARRGMWNDLPDEGYPQTVTDMPPFPDLLKAGYLVELPAAGNGDGGADGDGDGNGGVGGGGGGDGDGDGDGNGTGGGGAVDGGGDGGSDGGGDGGIDGGGNGNGGGGGGGNGGGEPNPIPLPPAALVFPGAAALAYWASRRMRRGV